MMHAYVLVLLSLYSGGLHKHLNICRYGADFDLKYKAIKGHIMVVKTKDQKQSFPYIYLCGHALRVTDEVKYLGPYLTSNLCICRDLKRQAM